ncbi:hypothetical protein BST61_g9784 [Cercospora zeina]
MRQPYGRKPNRCALTNAKVSQDRKPRKPNVRSRFQNLFHVRKIALTRVKNGRIDAPQRYRICRMYNHTFPVRVIDRNREEMRFIHFRESTFRFCVWVDPNGMCQWMWNELERYKKMKSMTRAEWLASLDPQRLEDWEKGLLARLQRNPERLEDREKELLARLQRDAASDLQHAPSTGKSSASQAASESQPRPTPKSAAVKECQTRPTSKSAAAREAPTSTASASTATRETSAKHTAKCFAERAPPANKSRSDAATEPCDTTEPASRIYKWAVEDFEHESNLMAAHIWMLERKKQTVLEDQAKYIRGNTSLIKHIRSEAEAVKKEQKRLEMLAASKKKEAEVMEKKIEEVHLLEDVLADRIAALDICGRSEVPRRQAPESTSSSAPTSSATAPPAPGRCAVKEAAAKKGCKQPTVKEESEE